MSAADEPTVEARRRGSGETLRTNAPSCWGKASKRSSGIRIFALALLAAIITSCTEGFSLAAVTPSRGPSRNSFGECRQDAPSSVGNSRMRIPKVSWSSRLNSVPSSSSSGSSSDRPYHRRKRRRLPNGEPIERRRKPCLGLLTFDLDDTLFPTEVVIRHANHRMVAFLNAEGYNVTVDDYLASARAVRKQWHEAHKVRVVANEIDAINATGIAEASQRKEGDRSPLSYTELRKRAIAAELRRLTGDPSGTFDDVVEEAYELWEHERHAAAEYYLDPAVVESLHAIRRHFGEHLCVAAITNGRGNPLKMPSLAPYFAFCVSGEDPDVFPHRKPHPKIFEVAMDKFRADYYHPADDTEPLAEVEGSVAAAVDPGVQDVLWCHVGDCLANDVGASADCGAFAVWYCTDPGTVASVMAARNVVGGGSSTGQDDDGSVGDGAGPGGGGFADFLVSLQALENSVFAEEPPSTVETATHSQQREQEWQLRPGWSTATQDEVERRNELASEAAQDKVSAHIYHVSQLLDVLKQVARPDRRAKMQRRRR
jgi:FMN phosphatase YigB (HAD superfamily)